MPLASTTQCPSLHPLIPLASFVSSPCDRCFGQRSHAVFGCGLCGYKVCKWCYLGGDRVVEIAVQAQQVLAELRREVEGLKGKVDSDLYAWV
jgi:hypothetical protein